MLSENNATVWLLIVFSFPVPPPPHYSPSPLNSPFPLPSNPNPLISFPYPLVLLQFQDRVLVVYVRNVYLLISHNRVILRTLQTKEYVQCTSREEMWGGWCFFNQIEPNWPLPYSTVPVPLLRDARPAGWVNYCSICASTMPRAQNRAEKGSILLWRRLALAILLLFIYAANQSSLICYSQNIQNCLLCDLIQQNDWNITHNKDDF